MFDLQAGCIGVSYTFVMFELCNSLNKIFKKLENSNFAGYELQFQKVQQK